MSFTSIRRAIVASTLVFGAAATLSPAAFAGTTANANIGGNVASTLSISTSNPNTNINLAPAQTDTMVKVADVQMGTNNSTGLNVTASGTFTLSNGQATPVNFQVGIDDGSATPVSYYSTNSKIYTSTTAAAATTPYSLMIKYSTDAAFQDPGIYSATVTLDVADN